MTAPRDLLDVSAVGWKGSFRGRRVLSVAPLTERAQRTRSQQLTDLTLSLITRYTWRFERYVCVYER